jgi:hypothetical protein
VHLLELFMPKFMCDALVDVVEFVDDISWSVVELHKNCFVFARLIEVIACSTPTWNIFQIYDLPSKHVETCVCCVFHQFYAWIGGLKKWGHPFCVFYALVCVWLAVVVTLNCAHTETHAFIPFVNHTQMKKLGNKF